MRPGFLVVDKAEGLTSHDIVGMLRAVTGIKRVGHTGTLDPFATGVLPVALGHATRCIRFLDESLKVYDATIQLGVRMDTGDLTGEAVAEAAVPELDAEGVREVLAGFAGTRMQVPPRYSAVKVKGKALYKYARQGEAVEAKARPVRIDSIELLELGTDRLRVRIRCGRGTYARVLGEEIAQELGTEGHLVALRRERSGDFGLEGALSLDELGTVVSRDPLSEDQTWRAVLRAPTREERLPWAPRDEVQASLSPRVMSIRQALAHLPGVQLPAPLLGRFKNGGPPPGPPEGHEGPYVVLSGDEVLAVASREQGPPKTLWRAPTNT